MDGGELSPPSFCIGGENVSIKVGSAIKFKKNNEIKSGVVVSNLEDINLLVVYRSKEDIIHRLHGCFVSPNDVISEGETINKDIVNYLAQSIIYDDLIKMDRAERGI